MDIDQSEFDSSVIKVSAEAGSPPARRPPIWPPLASSLNRLSQRLVGRLIEEIPWARLMARRRSAYPRERQPTVWLNASSRSTLFDGGALLQCTK